MAPDSHHEQVGAQQLSQLGHANEGTAGDKRALTLVLALIEKRSRMEETYAQVHESTHRPECCTFSVMESTVRAMRTCKRVRTD